MRLFVGLFLPQHVEDHLRMAVESVNDDAAVGITGRGRSALRWIAQQDRHITLAFYGEVPSGAAEDLAANLQEKLAATTPPALRLRGAGVFSGRALWAGVQEQATAEHSSGSSALMDLMRKSEEAGRGYIRNAEASQNRERRRAHVTLARIRDRRKGATEARRKAEALAVYEGPVWTADAAQLVLSELGAGKSGAPRYSVLADLPLGQR